MKVKQVLVQFDDNTELVIDEIGEKLTPFDIGQRITFVIYRVLAGEMALDDEIFVCEGSE